MSVFRFPNIIYTCIYCCDHGANQQRGCRNWILVELIILIINHTWSIPDWEIDWDDYCEIGNLTSQAKRKNQRTNSNLSKEESKKTRIEAKQREAGESKKGQVKGIVQAWRSTRIDGKEWTWPLLPQKEINYPIQNLNFQLQLASHILLSVEFSSGAWYWNQGSEWDEMTNDGILRGEMKASGPEN